MRSITYATYDDMWKVCRDMALRVPLSVEAVVGVPTSGLAPAGMISSLLRVPCVPIEEVPDHYRHLLVVEDSTQGMRFKQQYQSILTANGRKVTWAAVYVSGRAEKECDMFGVVAPKPRVWQWNLFKYILTPQFAFDLDGVLCRDPTPEENDDGEKYKIFCLTVPAYIRGGMKCMAIVTNRLEKYRAETEAWLKINKVQHAYLIMSQHKTAHERRLVKDYAEQKAAWYGSSGAILFVESDDGQARKIAEITGKPVVSIEGRGYNTRQIGKVIAEPPKEIQPIQLMKNHKIMYAIATGYHALDLPIFENVPEGWDTAVVTDKDCPKGLTPKEMVTWAKCHGPTIFRNYEASLCVDDDMTKIQGDPATILGNPEWAMVYSQAWGTVKDDLEGLMHCRVVSPQLARRDIEVFGAYRNRLTGIMYRRHTDEVRKVCARWWELSKTVATKRDQPALAKAFVDVGFVPTEFGNRVREKIAFHDKWRGVKRGWRIAHNQKKPTVEDMKAIMPEMRLLTIEQAKQKCGLSGDSPKPKEELQAQQERKVLIQRTVKRVHTRTGKHPLNGLRLRRKYLDKNGRGK